MAHLHLIGIGGAGLSAIATVLLQQNYIVSGSDMQASVMTERLKQLGATIFIGHQAANLTPDIEAVIISSAISADNPELCAARDLGLRIYKRDEWLGQMMVGQRGIAIAGTHGKTTTTAMTAFMLQQLGQDPTYIIGGYVPQLHSNAAAGNSGLFVIEADEYDHTFLGLHPEVAVITFVEWDHPDIFPTYQHVQQAFHDFVRLVPLTGLVIACGDDMGVQSIIPQATAPVITYGLQSTNQWQATNLQLNSRGGYDFQCMTSLGLLPFTVSLAIPGLHNVTNALAVLIIAQHYDLDLSLAVAALSEFTGANRRFQLKGEVHGVTIIDDYAHHPTEIKVTLAAARARFGNRRIWAVFQPHTFSRTQTLLTDFAQAFTEADQVIITDIFASREKDTGQISSHDLLAVMTHPQIQHISTLRQATDYLLMHLTPNDVLITLGAGDGYLIGEWLLAELA